MKPKTYLGLRKVLKGYFKLLHEKDAELTSFLEKHRGDYRWKRILNQRDKINNMLNRLYGMYPELSIY